MYDTRWPRPGPAMAAVAALLGLVAGTVLGLASPVSAPTADARAPVETTVASTTTTTLPEEFHTVVLGSYENRANADRRLQQVRNQGARDADLLDQVEWQINTPWAVYSGQFGSRDEAEAHRQELTALGVTPSFWKHVTRRD